MAAYCFICAVEEIKKRRSFVPIRIFGDMLSVSAGVQQAHMYRTNLRVAMLPSGASLLHTEEEFCSTMSALEYSEADPTACWGITRRDNELKLLVEVHARTEVGEAEVRMQSQFTGISQSGIFSYQECFRLATQLRLG